MKRRTLTLRRDRDEQTYQVDVLADNGELRATAGGRDLHVKRDGNGRFRISSDRTTTTAWSIVDGETRWVFVDGAVYELSESRPKGRARARSHAGSLSAPMPATVRRIMVKPGDIVRPGDILVVLEAMKMELPIRADANGVVNAVSGREGDLVQPGVELIEISVLPSTEET